MCKPKNSILSFTPVNTNIIATPYFTYLNFSCSAQSTKYRLLRPRIAKILEVYTIKGSVVMEKIAGIESIANITSEDSISISMANSGVAYS